PTITPLSSNQPVEYEDIAHTPTRRSSDLSHGGAAASDVCSGVTWSNNFTSLSDLCGATGAATVTFTATDDCGNSSSTTATFTIEDKTKPTFTTHTSNQTVECDGRCNNAQL